MSSSAAETEPKQIIATNANDSKLAVTEEPKAMSMEQRRSSIGRDTISTYTDDESGFLREKNECTEFCTDLCTCFGACDACCPSTGEGFMSTFAAFVGNMCVACCKR